MIYVPCDFCGSKSFKIWGVSITADSLHFTQVRCKNCGLFYANPEATIDEIREYYKNYYSKEEKFYKDYKQNKNQEIIIQHVESDLNLIKKYVSSGKLLDVGCGLGLAMKAAQNLGFSPSGIEISGEAVEYAKREFGFTNTFVGTIEEVEIENESFDVVFSWHVIEHVPSLTSYMKKINSVLRKDGILMIGTENNVDLFYSLKRYAKILCGQVPDLPTSTEHTYGFTAKTMKNILEHFGFEVLRLDIYEDNARNSFLDQAKRGSAGVIFVKKIILRILFGISKVLPTGKKLKVIARKK